MREPPFFYPFCTAWPRGVISRLTNGRSLVTSRPPRSLVAGTRRLVGGAARLVKKQC